MPPRRLSLHGRAVTSAVWARWQPRQKFMLMFWVIGLGQEGGGRWWWLCGNCGGFQAASSWPWIWLWGQESERGHQSWGSLWFGFRGGWVRSKESSPLLSQSWEHRATVEMLAALRHPTVNTGQERNANVVGTLWSQVKNSGVRLVFLLFKSLWITSWHDQAQGLLAKRTTFKVLTRNKVLHKIDECKNGSGSDEQSCARKESFHLRNTFYRQKNVQWQIFPVWKIMI